VSKVTHLIPEWQVLDLPFIFETYQDVEKVFTGETGKQLLAMLDRKGIKGLALWGNGFKQMMSNRRLLVERGDFSGLKFRVMPSEVIEKQFQLLGATPVVVPFNHVYKALEKHEFDGQENTISNIYSKGFYQFQPYLTISNHGYLGYAVMINQTFWNGLPKEIQESIMEAVKETTDWNLTQSKAQNEAELALMMQHERTHIYELTEKEREKWKEMFSSLYAQFRKEFGSKLLKQIEHEKGKAE
jgi:tripartite ATP-independent transporter DctP family solute receptor